MGELHVLGAVGKPTAWTVGCAKGKPAKFGGGGGSGSGVGTVSEPELHMLGAIGEPTVLHYGWCRRQTSQVWCCWWWGWSWYHRGTRAPLSRGWGRRNVCTIQLLNPVHWGPRFSLFHSSGQPRGFNRAAEAGVQGCCCCCCC